MDGQETLAPPYALWKLILEASNAYVWLFACIVIFFELYVLSVFMDIHKDRSSFSS